MLTMIYLNMNQKHMWLATSNVVTKPNDFWRSKAGTIHTVAVVIAKMVQDRDWILTEGSMEVYASCPTKGKKGKVLPYSLSSVGPELILVYRQSARRWLKAIHPAVGCRYFTVYTMPPITFPAEECHRPSAGTKLYLLVTEAHALRMSSLPNNSNHNSSYGQQIANYIHIRTYHLQLHWRLTKATVTMNNRSMLSDTSHTVNSLTMFGIMHNAVTWKTDTHFRHTVWAEYSNRSLAVHSDYIHRSKLAFHCRIAGSSAHSWGRCVIAITEQFQWRAHEQFSHILWNTFQQL